jgi:hypothetical protein
MYRQMPPVLYMMGVPGVLFPSLVSQVQSDNFTVSRQYV